VRFRSYDIVMLKHLNHITLKIDQIVVPLKQSIFHSHKKNESITIFEFQSRLHDEATCIDYLTKLQWA
jgi:hypothetical protein